MDQRERESKHIEDEQARVPWPDKILIHLQEHLYLVDKGAHKVVKCFCGHEFGDATENWKYRALVYDRNPIDIYPKATSSITEWITLREFYCPSCGVQLEVESTPHGLPFIFSFEPDLVDSSA